MSMRAHSGALPGSQRGVALLVVLWGLVLLSTVAVSYAYTVRGEARIARNQLEAARAAALAEAGVTRALGALLGTERTAAERLAAGASFALEEGTVHWRARNAAGRVAINTASAALLARLLEGLGVAPDVREALVDAVLDWRDADELRRLHGAEDTDYRAAGLAHGSGDAPFAAPEELLLVLGMTPELFERLEPFVITDGTHRGVNPRFASRDLLLALGVAEAHEIDAYVAARDADPEQVPPLAAVGDFLTTEISPFHVLLAEGRTLGGARVQLETVVGPAEDAALVVRTWRAVQRGGVDDGGA